VMHSVLDLACLTCQDSQYALVRIRS